MTKKFTKKYSFVVIEWPYKYQICHTSLFYRMKRDDEQSCEPVTCEAVTEVVLVLYYEGSYSSWW